MVRYVLGRLVNTIPVLVFITFAVFLMIYLLPGDPATVILGQNANEENVAYMRHKMGLDRPFLERYLVWLSLVVRGDLGESFLSKKTVTSLIADAFPVTLELTIVSLVVALIIAFPAGILSGLKKDSWVDLVASVTAFLGVSTPSFWLGIMLAYLFSVHWRLLPPSGFTRLNEGLLQNLRGLVLPAITLGIFLAAPLTRYLRAGVLSTLQQDHVRTARGKGLPERYVVFHHIVRNALIPFLTVLGMQFGYLLGGAVVIEQVFALPGMGRTAIQAIFDRDYTVVQGMVLVVACSFVFVNLLVDLIYSVLDPRIRVGGKESL